MSFLFNCITVKWSMGGRQVVDRWSTSGQSVHYSTTTTGRHPAKNHVFWLSSNTETLGISQMLHQPLATTSHPLPLVDEWSMPSTIRPLSVHYPSTNMKSIRELAQHLSVAHSTVSAHMERLGIEGQSQGPGKATLLTEEECLDIAASIHPAIEALPIQSVEVVLSTPDIELQAPEYKVADSTFSRELQTRQMTRAIQGWKTNAASLRQALLALAREQGTQLAHEMHQMKLGTAISESQNLERQIAQDLGLTQNPSDEF